MSTWYSHSNSESLDSLLAIFKITLSFVVWPFCIERLYQYFKISQNRALQILTSMTAWLPEITAKLTIYQDVLVNYLV